MTTTLARQAADRAAYQSAHGPRFPGPNDGAGQCMMRNRLLVDAPPIGDYDHDGSADAEDGWKFAKRKHPTSDPAEIPGGCYVWWGGGSHDNGHVAYADPDRLDWCWSTDIRRAGYFDLVPIELISQKWGLPLLGWSEDIDGVTVWTPPAPPLQPAAKEDPNMALLADLDTARKAHGASRAKAARVLLRAMLAGAGPIRTTRLRAALAALKGIAT